MPSRAPDETGGGVILPVRLQKDYTSYLYGALPLCVVLGIGHVDWYLEHYVELFSVSGAGAGAVTLDFLDSQIYEEVVETDRIDRVAAEMIPDFSAYASAQLRENTYLIVFLNLGQLAEAGGQHIHEVLIYGYHQAEDQFLFIGFDGNRQFASMTASAAELRLAYTSGLLAMADPGSRFSKIKCPLLLMRSKGIDYSFDVARFHRRLARSVVSDREKVGEKLAMGSWWLGGHDPAADVGIAVGAALYPRIEEYFGGLEASPGATEFFEYRCMHTLAEHKRAMLNRAVYLHGRPELELALAPEVRELEIIARQADAVRHRALFALVGGREKFPFPGLVDTLRGIQARERCAFEGILSVLADRL